MKRKGISCALTVLLILVTMSAAMVSAVSAEECQQWSIDSDDEQIKLINELWGTDITIGEYYEKVFPLHLEGLEKDLQNHLYTLKVTWPEPDLETKVASADTKDTNLAAKFEELGEQSGIKYFIVTFGDSTISAVGRSVRFKSESWVVFPPYLRIPYMEVTSYLLRWDGGQGHVVDLCANAAYSVYNIKAQKTSTVNQAVVADHSTENQNAEKYGKFILDPGKWVSCLAPVNQPQ